ncbi:MAG: 3-hydroxybutyrate oligomer hydrolase family protein [Burkholderiales bacterium]
MRPSPFRSTALVLALAAAALVAGCGDDTYTPPDYNTLPPGITNLVGPTTYDGVTDDLLTGGLGKTGIGAAAPGFADPLNPTSAELRRRAIYTNYRGIIDFTAAGGYGVLYGPNIDVNGNDTLGEGKIAGKEILAYVDDGTGKKNVGVMVQIPASFDKNNPCIIAGPSSGSRGVYGAIGTAGDWGLKHGCAVAYTDAGKGTGYQDLAADKVNLIDGKLVARSTAGTLASFASDLTGAALAAFNAAYPNRIAYKHVYSQQNPEKDWGKNVLDSLRFAFWAINEQYGETDSTGKRLRTYGPANTLVIASGVSNGGAESLQALEQDSEGLIDALAVAEPNAQPNDMSGVTINFNGAAVPNAGKPLIDYFSYRMIYELCASLSTSAQAPNGVRPGWIGFGTAPVAAINQVAGVELQTIATNRCQSLAQKGLVTGTTAAQQADSALAKMQQYGWPDALQDALIASHYRLADIYVAFGYVVAYGKFSVSDNVCGLSLAGADATGNVAAQVPAVQATLFSTSNGLNTGGDVIYNDSVGGAKLYHVGVSPSTGRMDGSLDAMLCLRSYVTGTDPVTGAALTGAALANSQRVQAGFRDVLLTGKLRNRPVVIVQGRSDALVPVNHASRAYTAFNSKVEGAANVRYYEIENGNHFDAFIPNAASGGVQGYDVLLVPVHYYFINAMDIVWAKLKNNTPLPPSQVVRAIPRGGTPGSAPPITTANVPKVSANPTAANGISVGAGVINVPN